MAADKTCHVCCPISLGDELFRADGTRLKGMMGERMMPYMDSIKQVYNVTFIFKESPDVGHRINASDAYTGCLGELQRGQSDFLLQGMDYPADLMNVSQDFVILDERISFLGAFVRPDAYRAADFISSFKTFHWSLYIIIAMYIYMLFIVLRVYRAMHESMIKSMADVPRVYGQRAGTQKMVRQYKKIQGVSMLDVVRHFLGTNDINRGPSFFVSQMTLLISCFSFFIFSYYYSLFNTELVSSAPAKIHENYRHLIERNVRPLFYKGTIYSQQLKHANEGTPERELWDWAVAKYGEKNLYVSRNFSQLASVMPQGILGNLVFFTGGTLTGPIKTTFCQILSRSWERMIGILGTYTRLDVDLTKYGDWQIYTRSSESAKNTIKSLFTSTKLQEDRELYKLVKSLFLHLFEMGLMLAEIRSFERMDLINNPAVENLIGAPILDRIEMKYRCQQNNALVPKLPKIDRIMPRYFLLSFQALASILLIAFCCLLCEKVHCSVYSTRKTRACSQTVRKNLKLPERRRISTFRRLSL